MDNPEKKISLRTEGVIYKYKTIRNYGKSEALRTGPVHVYNKISIYKFHRIGTGRPNLVWDTPSLSPTGFLIEKWDTNGRGDDLNKEKNCIGIDRKRNLQQQWIGITSLKDQEAKNQSEYEVSYK